MYGDEIEANENNTDDWPIQERLPFVDHVTVEQRFFEFVQNVDSDAYCFSTCASVDLLNGISRYAEEPIEIVMQDGEEK